MKEVENAQTYISRTRWCRLTYPCPSPTNTTKWPGNYSTGSNKRILKIENKKCRNLSTWGMTMWWVHWVFFLPSVYSWTGCQRDLLPEPPKGMENKNKSLFSRARRPGEGKPNRNLVRLHTRGLGGSLICPHPQQEQQSTWASQPLLHNLGPGG